MLDSIYIILSHTSHPGNIGSAARAMMTMGLSNLRLINPKKFPSAKATALSSGAHAVLDNATVHGSVEEAIADCTLVFGTSARERTLPWPLVSARSMAEVIRSGEAGAEGKVAILFGTEHSGLSNEELQHCHYHVTIPSNPQFSSLNLAAAVQVISYELRTTLMNDESVVTNKAMNQPVPAEQLEQYYQHLEQTLCEIEFLDADNPRHLMARIRRLYGRAKPDSLELNILRGILTKTQQAARG